MKRYLRKITKRSRGKFEHSLSIPADFVRKLNLSDCIVEIKKDGDSLIIKKIEEKIENNTLTTKNESDNNDDDFTVH